MGLYDKLNAHREEKLKAEKEAGIAFLAANKTKPGVTELPGGIQYQVIREGTGVRPKSNSVIKAHYRGSLLNGKEFDSSYKRNQPFTAPLGSLIKGWQQVIPLMPAGSTWRLWIPSDLAYGDRGAGGDIPGGAALQFDIELLEIVNGE
jgi:FKBP-type peptidyl-prolyl cis-trans isomerase FklB